MAIFSFITLFISNFIFIYYIVTLNNQLMLDLKESNLLLLKEIKNFSNQQHELFISLEKTKSLVLIEQTKQQLSLTPIAIKTNKYSSLFLDTFGSNINMTLFAFGVTVTVLGAGFMYYNINSILLNSGFTKLITAFDGCYRLFHYWDYRFFY
jgi:hypothetical protein